MQKMTARMMLLALVLVISLGFSCNKANQSNSGNTGTVSSGGGETTSGGGSQAMQPNPATEFSFKTPDGQLASVSQYLGKPLVVNFWADWWGPCKQEFPAFQQSYTEHNGAFELLAVAAPSAEDPGGFMKQNGYSFPWVHDVDGGQKFGVSGIPHTFFIDAQGNLVDSQLGSMSHDVFEQKLAQILK